MCVCFDMDSLVSRCVCAENTCTHRMHSWCIELHTVCFQGRWGRKGAEGQHTDAHTHTRVQGTRGRKGAEKTHTHAHTPTHTHTYTHTHTHTHAHTHTHTHTHTH